MNTKNIILLILVIIGISLFPSLRQHSKGVYSLLKQHLVPAIDKPASRYLAPDFVLVDLDKNEFKLSDARGKIVAIMFWTTW